MDKRDFDPKDHLRTVRFNTKDGRTQEKQILDTAPRVAWFRAEHPMDSGWQLVTLPIADDENGCQFKAAVISPDGKEVATGYRWVGKGQFGNHREKAETQAIGRALANAGFGTIFALETTDDESNEPGDKADAPIAPKNNGKPVQTELPKPQVKHYEGATGFWSLINEKHMTREEGLKILNDVGGNFAVAIERLVKK